MRLLLLCAFTLVFAQPKLVVVVVVDQMRGDYLQTFTWQLKGFKTLLQGTYFKHCYYRHANNMTGPGHATLLTGNYPHRHGIVGNYFRQEEKVIYCVEDAKYPCVGCLTRRGYSPRWLLTATLGDVLRKHYPSAKVVSIALKDRAAILMGGKKAPYVFWFDTKQLRWTTSYYYRGTLPQWVEQWNNNYLLQRFLGASWKKQLPDSLVPFKDDQPWEGNFPGGNNTFPHTLPTSLLPASRFAKAFLLSPFSITYTFDFAKHAIRKLQLGKDVTPDLLCLSISTTDYVGHYFGPQSRELWEIYFHLDSLLQDFILFLDETVGKNQYVLALTSDHGVAPIPEQHPNGKRLSPYELKKQCDKFLKSHFNDTLPSSWIQKIAMPYIFLQKQKLNHYQLNEDSVAAVLKSYLQQQEAFIAVWTKKDFEKDAIADSTLHTYFIAAKRSFHPKRSGELFIVHQPYYLIEEGYKTNHYTAYDYDAWVPLLFYGSNIPQQVIEEAVEPIQMVPTLAKWLKLPVSWCEGKPLKIQ